MLVDRDRLGEN
ncbi:hypothetical protein YPPY95_4732, partial [Yersinia pestis PY-95]